MLSIPTRELRLFRTLAKALCRIRRRSTGLNLIVRNDHDDLLPQTLWQGFGIQLRLPNAADGIRSDFAFVVPFDTISDALKPRRGEVHLTPGDSKLEVRWSDRGVPRRLRLPLEEPAESQSLPSEPERRKRMPAWFTEAFVIAASVTNQHTSRYALSCLQLDGSRHRMVATDGVQAFVQNGLDWPWTGEVLLPASLPLGHRELPAAPVEVGRVTVPSDVEGGRPKSDSVLIRTGHWSFWAPVESGRFPEIDRVVPNHTADTVLALDRTDALSLCESIDGLPGDPDAPVRLELNDRVAVVAESGEERAELVLGRSRRLGAAASISMRRSFLKRATAMRFDDLQFFGSGRPAVGCDRRTGVERQYVWMTLCSEAESRTRSVTSQSAKPDAGRTEPVPVA